MNDRRAVIRSLITSGVAGAVYPAAGQTSIALRSMPRALRNVMSFGAKADGVTDDSAAFNAATMAMAQWSDELGVAIHVPAGHYRVKGEIYLRKGQSMSGDGDATLIDASGTHGTTLVMGEGPSGRADPGGAPLTLSRLRFLGGSDTQPLIRVNAHGFALHDLFLSAVGTGIHITGSDGLLSGITIDQALRGLVFSRAQNIVVQGLISYLANFAISLESGVNDVVLANAILAYSRYASIMLSESATDIAAIRVANSSFVSNEAFKTFLGHVHVRSGPCQASFAACSFHNWPGFAVAQAAGRGADLTFADCRFDGSPSRREYTPSTSARGLLTGVDARIRMNGCTFRKLHGEVVKIGPGLDSCVIEGGSIEDCPAAPVVFTQGDQGLVRVKGVDGFGQVRRDARGCSLILPWWGSATGWQVSVRTTTSPGGIATAHCYVVEGADGMEAVLAPQSAHGVPLGLTCTLAATPTAPPRAAPATFGQVTLACQRPDAVWSVETVA